MSCDSRRLLALKFLKLPGKMKLNIFFVLKIVLVLFCAAGIGDCGIIDYFRRLNKERIELVLPLQIE